MSASYKSLRSILRRCPLATLLAPAIIICAVGMVRESVAELTADCPTHIWFGQNPSNSDHADWSEDAQGVAHDDEGNWFFTANEGDQQPYRLLKYGSNWQEVEDGTDNLHLDGIDGIPAELVALGYNHYGDPDHYAGYVFVPFEGDGKAAIAAIQASDLSLVDFVELHTCCQEKVGWVAINPAERPLGNSPNQVALYSSQSHLTEFLKYTLDMEKLKDLSIRGDFLSDPTPDPVVEANGNPVTTPFQHMQGGTFSPWGDFYIINGFPGVSPSDARGGIHLFRRNNSGHWQLMQNSVQETPEIGEAIFGFEYDPFAVVSDKLGQEPEGIDWWSRGNDPNAPYPGQLHAILLDNDINDDDIYFKHYRVDYWCVANDDTDGDGLLDGDEVDVHGTSPILADTDGDGAIDGADAFPLDPSETTDTDGDGIGDNADLDDDNDGLPDALDAAPNDADADDDGLLDGEDVEFVQVAIAGLPSAALRAPSDGTRNAMMSMLEDIEALLLEDDATEAIQKLINLKRRLDGCGANADSNDWVLDCFQQIELQPLVDLLIANLEDSV